MNSIKALALLFVVSVAASMVLWILVHHNQQLWMRWQRAEITHKTRAYLQHRAEAAAIAVVVWLTVGAVWYVVRYL